MAEAAVGRDDAPGPGPSALAPADTTSSRDAQLSELRSILVGPEQRDLRALQAHLRDGAARTREVSLVLPEAIAIAREDPRLSRALAPMVEDAITSSVQRDPRPLADALFPVMGPAIRRAIEHMLASMMESFNRTVEHSLSWRALRWRVTAWRTGKSFAEVVLLNTLRYRVEEVFLIHAENGLLLQHVSSSAQASQDADQVSAMLTAIRDFVRDSFAGSGGDSLDAFRVGDLSVTVEQGPYAVIAGVVRGAAPPDVRDMLRQALESIHLMLGSELKAFNGDAAPFSRAKPALEACLVTQLREPPARRSYRAWKIAAALLVIGLGTWVFLTVRERQRWGTYLDRLAAEPGLVVISSGRRDGRFVVSGLRDPLAGDPATLLASAQLDPARVDAHWEPYAAMQPQFVVTRATTLLRPPAGVALEYRDGVLEARGPASVRWLIDSERMAPAIAGVRAFAYAGSSAAEQLGKQLEALTILFPKGRAELSPDQVAQVTSGAALLATFADALRLHGQQAQIEVRGHTDNDGSDLSNGPLSSARAEAVRHILSVPAHEGIVISATGVGSSEPATAGVTETEKVLNRRASLRVTLSAAGSQGSRQ